MIRAILAIGVSLVAVSLFSAPSGDEWQNNEVLSCGREPVRAAFSSFDTVGEALKILPEFSPRQRSLDSDTEWKFRWTKDPQSRSRGFFYPDYDVSSWETIKVPCSWQAYGANGKGGWGTAIYTNIRYPFARDVPGGSKVMGEPPKNYTSWAARNPVGQYRREFTVPREWEGQDIFLKFDGVDSFFYLWVNGEYVGFSKDSRSPAEFKVTSLVKPGAKNVLALEVYRYSDGSYLEDQDMFRLSGIFRGTWVLARPKNRIRDFFATARPCIKGEYDGAWEVTVEAEGLVENYLLYDWDDNLVAGPFASGKFTVAGVKLWSAESPACYKLVLQGAQECVSSVFGFRVSEISGGRYYLNGQPIKLKGANRHETDPLYGHYVPRFRHEQDIALLKAANCNAVRNAHYPQDDYWYYLCNIHGIYLVDEANVESHGYGYGVDSLSHQPSWRKATVARNLAMVERNKNHPCVVIWSYGNEAGPGENFAACRDAIKARDTTRPTHYERDWSVADMEGCQYPGVAWCWSKAADSKAGKPFYISEYAHNMANAMGNLKDYQDAIESSDVILGATIWDWVDQGLWKVKPDGTRILAYGGDFGDEPNDGLFVMNGCVLSDRTPEPGYWEIKHVYQNWSVKATNHFQRLVVKNKNYFVDSSGVGLRWVVLRDGAKFAAGEFELRSLKPQQEAFYDMPAAVLAAGKGDSSVSVRFSFCKDGAEIASDQVDVRAGRESRPLGGSDARFGAASKVAYAEDGKTMTFAAKDLAIVFSKGTALPISVKKRGLFSKAELLKSPFRIEAFRAPSSNETGPARAWRNHGFDSLRGNVREISAVSETCGALSFTTLSEWRGETKLLKPVVFHVAARWTVYGNGTVACVSKIRPLGPKCDLPRIGYAFELSELDPQVEWFGRGPFENYPDRKSGAFAGHYRLRASEFFFPYAHNEDCGNREDTVAFCAGGLFVRTLGAPFAFSVNPYSPAQLLACSHPAELPPSDRTYVGVYAATRGLGGASCGPGPMERDIIRTDRDYDLSFTLAFSGRLTAQVPDSTALPALPERALAGGERVVACSSREPGEGEAEHLVDGDLSTIWHTQYGTTMGNFPHSVSVELERETLLKGLVFYGRQHGENGRVKDFRVETSIDGEKWHLQAEGSLTNGPHAQAVEFKTPVRARYYRFTALNNHHGNDFASMAEIEPIK